MPIATLRQQAYNIAKNAFIATFVDSRDENSVIEKFSKKWSKDFSLAIQKYVGMCKGIYPGGPVIAAPYTTLQQDIFNAAKNALKETYLSNEYDNQVEIDFGNGMKTAASSVATYMGTCKTILGVYPTFMSPGGPIIAPPSTPCVPAFKSASYKALTNTFQKSDQQGIAQIFSNIFQQTGQIIGTYVAGCTSLPGGGPLVAN